MRDFEKAEEFCKEARAQCIAITLADDRAGFDIEQDEDAAAVVAVSFMYCTDDYGTDGPELAVEDWARARGLRFRRSFTIHGTQAVATCTFHFLDDDEDEDEEPLSAEVIAARRRLVAETVVTRERVYLTRVTNAAFLPSDRVAGPHYLRAMAGLPLAPTADGYVDTDEDDGDADDALLPPYDLDGDIPERSW